MKGELQNVGAHVSQVPEDPGDLFDYALIRDWLRFMMGAIRRRKWVAIGVFFGVMVLAAVALWMMPKSYVVETRILAQQNRVMPALGNPNRAIPLDSDAPTRAASETVMRRDNLVALVKSSALMDQWDKSRAPAVRIKDFFARLIGGEPTEEDRLDALVGLLEQRLYVMTGEGTVLIGILWPDPQMAYRLVESAQQNFLEARHVNEVSIIAEAISILEAHAANVHDSIQGTIEEIDKARENPRAVVSAGLSEPSRRRSRRTMEDPEAAQLKVILTAKRRAIRDLEDFRGKKLMELQSDLLKARSTFAEEHPTVVDLRQGIASLNEESPQVASLKKEEAELEKELDRRESSQAAASSPGASKAKSSDDSADAPALEPEPQRYLAEEALSFRRETSDNSAASQELAKDRLKIAIAKYNGLLDRIDGARIELDTARAAFKYRYSVIRPAQVPKAPIKPKVPLVMAAASFLGVALAMLAAALWDLRVGRIEEKWQIYRSLGVDHLGDISSP